MTTATQNTNDVSRIVYILLPFSSGDRYTVAGILGISGIS